MSRQTDDVVLAAVIAHDLGAPLLKVPVPDVPAGEARVEAVGRVAASVGVPVLFLGGPHDRAGHERVLEETRDVMAGAGPGWPWVGPSSRSRRRRPWPRSWPPSCTAGDPHRRPGHPGHQGRALGRRRSGGPGRRGGRDPPTPTPVVGAGPVGLVVLVDRGVYGPPGPGPVSASGRSTLWAAPDPSVRGLADASGAALGPAIIWSDRRAGLESERLAAALGGEQVFARTGVPLEAGAVTAKVALAGRQ